MLECTPQNVGVRFQIDGVWHNVDPRERANSGDLIVAVLKTMAGLDANERVKRQEGMFPADYKGVHYGVNCNPRASKPANRRCSIFIPRRPRFTRSKNWACGRKRRSN